MPSALFATQPHVIVWAYRWMVEIETGMERDKRNLFNNLRREIRDHKVLSAMEQVPRDLFVPSEVTHDAYKDIALPIGAGQTISQPYIVALMTNALDLVGGEKVLELGTGSGYQAAILSHLVPQGRVLSLERFPGLAEKAASLLGSLGYSNVEIRVAGDTLGSPEDAPFDAIMVTAAAPSLSPVLLKQLAVRGRMVVPIGPLKEQELTKVLRTDEGHSLTMLGPCRFVPLIGRNAWPPEYEKS